ncbi:MAG: hypothetical protein PHT51_03395 [Patescibacteria group bacterium]|nr:hypothetical protein [Patescibacteria group bacterium]MDD4611199.1 hypothetical protein [Patescibacteria group bacterium]
MKKALLIVGAVLAVIILLAGGFVVYNYVRIQRGDLVKWDNQWYTKEELAKKFPPQVYEVEAKNTPEEVYADFCQALLANDTDKALSYIVEKNRDEYRKAFEDKTKLENWVKKLPEKITKENEYRNFAYYDINMGTKMKNTVSFIKNQVGFWEIDRI